MKPAPWLFYSTYLSSLQASLNHYCFHLGFVVVVTITWSDNLILKEFKIKVKDQR